MGRGKGREGERGGKGKGRGGEGSYPPPTIPGSAPVMCLYNGFFVFHPFNTLVFY